MIEPPSPSSPSLDLVFQAVRDHPQAVVPVDAVAAALGLPVAAGSAVDPGVLAALDALVVEGNLSTWAASPSGPAVILSAHAAKQCGVTLATVAGRMVWRKRRSHGRPRVATGEPADLPESIVDPADPKGLEPWEEAADREIAGMVAEEMEAEEAAEEIGEDFAHWQAGRDDTVSPEQFRQWMSDWRASHHADPRRRTDANRLPRPRRIAGAQLPWPVTAWPVSWKKGVEPCPGCGGRPLLNEACVIDGCDAWGLDHIVPKLRKSEREWGCEGEPGRKGKGKGEGSADGEQKS